MLLARENLDLDPGQAVAHDAQLLGGFATEIDRGTPADDAIRDPDNDAFTVLQMGDTGHCAERKTILRSRKFVLAAPSSSE